MKHKHYLLLIEAYEVRDCDEWLGIYHDDETLKTAYETAAELIAQHPVGYSSAYQVSIYEFLPVEVGPQITHDRHVIYGQRFRKRAPEDLMCFRSEETLCPETN